MWVVMVQHKTTDQYLTSGKVSTRSIHWFKRYRLLKTSTKNFNILSNAYEDADADTDTDANANADADADAMVTAIALPVLSYRRANRHFIGLCFQSTQLSTCTSQQSGGVLRPFDRFEVISGMVS